MLSWSIFRLDESRADGAVFSILVLAFASFTWWRKRRWVLLPGSLWILGALACGLLPLILLARQHGGWAPSLGGLVDRAPLLSAWVLVAAVASWGHLDARRLAPPLLFGGALAACMGILQALGWDPPGYDSLLSIRPAYPFAGPSHAVEVLLPLLLLGLSFLPQDLRSNRLGWMALIPIALQLGYLGSTAARLGLFAGALLLLLRQRGRRMPVVLALVLVICGELGRSLLGGSSILPPDSAPRGVSVRKEIYLASAEHFLTHPLGLGIGRFESDYPEWRPEEEARLSSGDWKDTSHRIPKTPHEEFLLAGLELGWAGSLLLAVALLRLGRARVRVQDPARARSRSSDPVWLGILALALFRSPFSDNPAALALAALLLGSDFASFRVHPRPWSSALPLTMALVAATPAWSQWRGEHFAALAVRDQDRLEQHLQEAVSSRPWDNRSLVLLGSYYLATQQWNAARDCFDQTLVYHPTDLPALTAYIKVEMLAPDRDEILMLRLLARAEQFAPFHPSVKQARVLWLEGHRKFFENEAVRRVQQGIPDAGPWWAATYLAEAYIAAVEGRALDLRKALFRASAVAPGGTKGLIERTADQPDLKPETIAQLTRRVFPQWPQLGY